MNAKLIFSTLNTHQINDNKFFETLDGNHKNNKNVKKNIAKEINYPEPIILPTITDIKKCQNSGWCVHGMNYRVYLRLPT